MPPRLTYMTGALLLLSMLGCTVWKPPTKTGWTSATSPEQFERLMWEAVQAGNMKEVTQHLGSSFIVIAPDGRRDRDGQVEFLRSLHLTGFQISDLESNPAGDHAIVTYTLTLQGAVAGRPLPGRPLRVLTMWEVATHGWVEVAQSITPEITPRPRPLPAQGQ